MLPSLACGPSDYIECLTSSRSVALTILDPFLREPFHSPHCTSRAGSWLPESAPVRVRLVACLIGPSGFADAACLVETGMCMSGQRRDLSVARVGLLLVVFGSLACAAEDEGRQTGRFAPGAGGGGSGIGAQPTLVMCGQTNLTRACQCGASSGRQVCDGSRWGMCECAGGDAPGQGSVSLAGNQRTDIMFDWERTEASAELGG